MCFWVSIIVDKLSELIYNKIVINMRLSDILYEIIWVVDCNVFKKVYFELFD